MELLDRYLQAVKKYLPWQRQEDILAELRANLESQLEEAEEGLGRPLTEAEAETWLKQVGPPMQMAARYQPQQYLIGPTLFPVYWFVLRTVLAWTLVVYAIVAAAQVIWGDPEGTTVLGAVLRTPGMLMTAAAWVTLIFAALEITMEHYPSVWPAEAIAKVDWMPSTLPPLAEAQEPGKKPRKYGHAVAEIVMSWLLLFWLLLVPEFPVLMFGPGASFLATSPFELAPAWIPFYWWIVGLNLVQAAWRSVDLFRGKWQKPHPIQQAIFKILGWIPLVLLLNAQGHTWLQLKHPETDAAQYGHTLKTINDGVYHGLLVVILIVSVQLIWEIAQLSIAAYRKRATEMK